MRESVSVVIPTFNSGDYIVDAVRSALNQTYPCEIIVVDDGSTDDTTSQLAPFAGRIKYLRQANQGVSVARNNGIRRASGDWIALLDADDLWHPQKIEVQLIALSRLGDASGIGMIGSRASKVMPPALSFQPSVRRLEIRDFMLTLPISPSSVLIRRLCFDKIGWFDPKFGPAADRDMWLRIVSNYGVLEVNSPCWWYRVHEKQMSRKSMQMNQEFRQVVHKFFVENLKQKRFRNLASSYIYIDAALAQLDEKRRLPAIMCLIRSFLLYPLPHRDPLRPHGFRLKLMARMLLGSEKAGGDVES
jgi:glycosyltransferase involved in cell wall biosynthesis